MGVYYTRVIPRDLFNEASLLKCLGRLWIVTEGYNNFLMLHTGQDFKVYQNMEDGSIYVSNITVFINNTSYNHYRPLNARDDWPLYLLARADMDADAIPVFDDDGNLSAEMQALLER